MSEPRHAEASNHSRRGFLAAATSAIALSFGKERSADAQSVVDSYIAHPPVGFEPMRLPGKVVKVTKGSDPSELRALMQSNQLWPLPAVAREMFDRAMCGLSGERSAALAMKKFVDPRDIVAIKVNGIALQNMATNYELIVPIVEAVLGAGVEASKITVYEQYPNFLSGTRVGLHGYRLPPGVRLGFHGNQIATMPSIKVFENTPTRYVKLLTDATAVISVSLIKDHSICGYTGALKNMTHGSIVNPHDHHANHASPQIAQLYNHPILKSRMRLNITDGFKLLYDEGPLDKNPRKRILHGAVYVSTDPVALDVIGWRAVEEARARFGLRTLEAVGRAPRYLQVAGGLGLGIDDPSAIRLEHLAI